jgi:Rrf2 family protein
MQITRQADYAARAVLHLARLEPNQKAATSAIAKEQNIPPSFLAKIVAQLSVAGLLHTLRGARGGVSLAKPPGEISLLEVIEAIDGPILLNECVADPSVCAFSESCPIHEVWREAQHDLAQRLNTITFDVILARDGNQPLTGTN